MKAEYERQGAVLQTPRREEPSLCGGDEHTTNHFIHGWLLKDNSVSRLETEICEPATSILEQVAVDNTKRQDLPSLKAVAASTARVLTTARGEGQSEQDARSSLRCGVRATFCRFSRVTFPCISEALSIPARILPTSLWTGLESSWPAGNQTVT